MNSDSLTPDFRRNVALDLILTILLCGLWNLVLQYNQIKTLNYLLKEDRFSYWRMYIFTVLTCGIYFVYHEYKKAEAFQNFLAKETPAKVDTSDPVLAAVLCVIGFNFVYDAILQTKINEYLNAKALDFRANP